MSGASLILAVIILFSTSAEAEQSYPDSLFRAGNRMYEQNSYTEAVNLYNQVLNQGFSHTNLYYNLGNANYQMGRLGDAIWAYEKGLKFNPKDGDLRFNLSVANARIVDRVEAPETIFILEWYGMLKRGFSPSQWLLIVSSFFLISGLLSLSGFLFQWAPPRILNNLVMGSLAVTILSSIIFADLYFDLLDKEEGVIVATEAKAYSAPTDIGNLLFVVHEGTKARISSQQFPWMEIELIDGKKGWVHSDRMRAL